MHGHAPEVFLVVAYPKKKSMDDSPTKDQTWLLTFFEFELTSVYGGFKCCVSHKKSLQPLVSGELPSCDEILQMISS